MKDKIKRVCKIGYSLSTSLGLVGLLVATGLMAQDAEGVPGYRLGARDVIEVRVFEEPNLNSQLAVSESGMVNLPPLGEVELKGLTPGEAQQKLKALLEDRLLQRATVSVRVSEFRSKPIMVIGAVTRPGPLNYSGRWTLLEAITAAGGLASGHAGKVSVLWHADNGLTDQVEIEVDELLVSANPRVNIPIFAGDLINVPQAVPITIFWLGEVSSRGPMVFKSNERISVLAAVAKAGGLSERASKKIVIKRQNAEGLVEELVVDYKAIISGKTADVTLADGDVLIAKKSFL